MYKDKLRKDKLIKDTIEIEHLPELNDPLLIAGFDGWGNALDISRGMAEYLIKKLNAEFFGKLKPDLFYRFDENRPVVNIKKGLLHGLTHPGGEFYYSKLNETSGRDLIIFKATEPNLQWFRFVDTFLSLCEKVGVRTIISLGGMYDNVLHTDTVISALASSEQLIESLKEKNIIAIDYEGPSAIHSTIQEEAQKRGFESISIWCHCPYYLQGTTHLGLLSHLGSLLSWIGGFELDTDELIVTWHEISKQIQALIDKNPELKNMINDLRKSKTKVSWNNLKKEEKVIHLKDFLKQR